MFSAIGLFLAVLPNLSEFYNFQTPTRYAPSYVDKIWFPDQSPQQTDSRVGGVQLASRLIDFQDETGEACELTPGAVGSCVRLDLCESAQEDLQRRQAPRICSFEEYMPVVCCRDNAPRFSAVADDQSRCPPVPTWATGSLSRTGRKSFDKCLDYIEPLFPCVETASGTETTYARADFDVCAVPPKFYFIVGGDQAALGEFPHMAALGYGEDAGTAEWNCGGSLISEYFVLTAAHCIYSPQNGDVSFARLGDVNINFAPEAAYLYKVVEIIPHPEYKSPDKYNDIALLKLDREVRFDAIVRPACINLDEEVISDEVEATGWGTTQFGGERATNLMKVTLNVFPHSACSTLHPPTRNLAQGILDDRQICAGHYTKTSDTCQGDSGGPIQVIKQNVYCMYAIVGITSFGKACGTPGIPAVYTRVSAYVPWIESVVWP